MRGSDVQQVTMYSYLSPEDRVPADHPLRAIREITDVILKQLSRTFSQMYSKIGRPSIPPEKLLRALLLQVLYTVRSERVLMEQPEGVRRADAGVECNAACGAEQQQA